MAKTGNVRRHVTKLIGQTKKENKAELVGQWAYRT